jgi:hypothetical protein
MATVQELVVLVTANTSQFQSGMARAEGSTSKFATAAKVGLAIAAVAAVKFVADSVEAYNEHQQALLQLQTTIKNSPALVGASTAAFEEQATALQNLTGFQDEEILKADAVLGRFGLTADQLQQINPLVLDYARATGQDAATAAGSLGKALLGNTRALKTIGISFTATGDRAKDFATIQASLESKVAGLSEAYGKTLPGQLAIAAAKFDDVKESVGKAVIPILSKLLDLSKPLIGVLQLVADNLDMVVLAGAGFAAWKFIPPLLDAIAVRLPLAFTGLGVTMLETATAVGSLGTAAVTAIPLIGMLGTKALSTAAGTQTAAEKTAELTKAFDEGSISAGQAAAQMRGVVPPAKAVADHLGDVADKSKDTAAEQAGLADQLEGVTADMQKQKEAARQLAGGMLGLVSSAKDLADKQAVVNRMQDAGHDSGKKYNDAVLDLLVSQEDFNGQLRDYAAELKTAGLSTDDAQGKVVRLGKSLGLTKGDVLAILNPLDQYKNKLDAIPSSVTTDVITRFTQVGNINPGGPHPHLAAGGIVTRPTMALVGESGPEAVIPLDKANQMGGNVMVDVYLDGEKVSGALDRIMTKRLERSGAIFNGAVRT